MAGVPNLEDAMKLSEALRLGEYALQPGFGHWIRTENGKPRSGCAVGRACIAAGYHVVADSESMANLTAFMDKTWPWTARGDYERSHNDRNTNYVLAQISYEYEAKRYSISQIADYIASLEPQDSPVTEPVATQELSHAQSL